MGRKPRIEYEGAIYHVIQRGNNKERIFAKDWYKKFFLEELKGYKDALSFKLYAFVVMDNHYHLVLQTLDKPLHKIMHFINSRYSKYYNKLRERSGHVFQGRYKAFLVHNDSYLLALLRYIHQNPLRANICTFTAEYEWSSDSFYRNNDTSFVDIDLILDMLSNKRSVALGEYEQFIEGECEDQSEFKNDPVIEERIYHGYQGNLQDILLKAEITKDLAVAKTAKRREGLDDILWATGLCLKDFELIKSGSRKRYLMPNKREYVRKALDNKFTLQEIGRNINLSAAAVLNLQEAQSGYGTK